MVVLTTQQRYAILHYTFISYTQHKTATLPVWPNLSQNKRRFGNYQKAFHNQNAIPETLSKNTYRIHIALDEAMEDKRLKVKQP